MPWNWQSPDWPNFRYHASDLVGLEAQFLRQSGLFTGSIAHVPNAQKQALTIEIMSEEAHQTSEIEGEMLNRDSLQSSLRRHFGLATDHRRIPPAEAGITEMMMDLYRDHATTLNHERLFRWHSLLTQGRRDLRDMGRYRTGADPMQVVSGPIHQPKVHFEAPPVATVPAEMDAFMAWYASTASGGGSPLPILTRAGIAHLYFVTIHPFEDGNGRIARAIAEKSLAEGLGHPALIPLSQTINTARKNYYTQLEQTNRSLDITPWLLYFAQTVLEAQAQAQAQVEFLIAKTHFLDHHRGQFNERQERAILRILREGPKGFAGGLSAENYIRITGATRPTATRDLHDLVEKSALTRTGQLKGTRYWIKL
ncbi:MAG: Fic family protein [Verrucomicrobiales bacterium]|nr:Fic family protein [Verrucomicrobiales bacterium]